MSAAFDAQEAWWEYKVEGHEIRASQRVYACCLLINMFQLTQPSPVPCVRGPPPAAREVRAISPIKLRFYCRYVNFELPDSIVDYECPPHTYIYVWSRQTIDVRLNQSTFENNSTLALAPSTPLLNSLRSGSDRPGAALVFFQHTVARYGNSLRDSNRLKAVKVESCKTVITHQAERTL